jgi:hypothetical protein
MLYSMNTRELSNSLTTLFSELIDGAPRFGYMLNAGDPFATADWTAAWRTTHVSAALRTWPITWARSARSIERPTARRSQY